jgi:hypothetical protein
MRCTLLPFPILLTLTLAACDSTATTRHEVAARAAAEQWLARSDAGDHAGAWVVGTPEFKVTRRKDSWEVGQARNYQMFGAPDRRELIAAKFTTTVPGWERADYVLIQYHRPMHSNRTLRETLVMKRTPNGWQIASYKLDPVQP